MHFMILLLLSFCKKIWKNEYGLFLSYRDCKFCKFPSWVGIVPYNSFWERCLYLHLIYYCSIDEWWWVCISRKGKICTEFATLLDFQIQLELSLIVPVDWNWNWNLTFYWSFVKILFIFLWKKKGYKLITLLGFEVSQ